MKTCGCCREEKPLGAFHKNRTARDGRQSICADCRRLPKKQCKECRLWKGPWMFHTATKAPDGRNARCKTCKNTRLRQQRLDRGVSRSMLGAMIWGEGQDAGELLREEERREARARAQALEDIDRIREELGLPERRTA